jgi:hypothetical protein
VFLCRIRIGRWRPCSGALDHRGLCVDDICLPAEQSTATEGFIGVVHDEPREYRLALRVISPDGDEVEHGGIIETRPSGRCGSPTSEVFVVVDEAGDVSFTPS